MIEQPYCHTCGRAHMLDAPHDPYSPEYRSLFFLLNGRYPTWDDAMAHCSPETNMLVRLGIEAWLQSKRSSSE